MPLVVSCPRCATRLKSGQPIPAGRSVSCPKCQLVFTLTEPTADAPALPPTPVPPPLPVRTPPVESIPAAVILDEPDLDSARPAAAGRDRDDDYGRPAGRSRGADRDDDPPRYKARRRPKRQPVLLLLIGGGIGLILLLLLIGGVLLIADPFNWRGGAPGELLAWAPADSTVVVYMDVDALREHEQFRNQAKAGPADRLGVKAEDVSAVLVAGKTFGGLDGEVTAVRLNRTPERDQLVRAAVGTEATANGKTYYRTREGGGLYFPGGRVMVLTRTTATMTALLQKPQGQVSISADLREVTSRGRGDFWIASLLPGGTLGPGFPVFPAGAGQPRWMLLCFTWTANTAEVRTEAAFPNAAAARQAAAGAESVRPTAGKGTYSVSRSGSTLIITSTVPIDVGKPVFPF